MRLLKIAYFTIAMADDTCSRKDGECAEDMSVLQVHEHKSASHVPAEASLVEYPEPSSSCKGAVPKTQFAAINSAIAVALIPLTKKDEITKQVYTGSELIWKNFITK